MLTARSLWSSSLPDSSACGGRPRARESSGGIMSSERDVLPAEVLDRRRGGDAGGKIGMVGPARHSLHVPGALVRLVVRDPQHIPPRRRADQRAADVTAMRARRCEHLAGCAARCSLSCRRSDVPRISPTWPTAWGEVRMPRASRSAAGRACCRSRGEATGRDRDTGRGSPLERGRAGAGTCSEPEPASPVRLSQVRPPPPDSSDCDRACGCKRARILRRALTSRDSGSGG
jgi:hypothetical protein